MFLKGLWVDMTLFSVKKFNIELSITSFCDANMDTFSKAEHVIGKIIIVFIQIQRKFFLQLGGINKEIITTLSKL